MDNKRMNASEEKRFGFGKNWNRFLAVLNEERIGEAERSLKEMLQCENLSGKRFLDIGSGSGLFSLAARRLGAEVFSFDFDLASVACTEELRRRYFPDDPGWETAQGSALNQEFMESLGTFDFVYSWGVLHHTGNLWKAMEHALASVQQSGTLFIAIYNDQGILSRFWKRVKQVYCSGEAGRIAVVVAFIPVFILGGAVKDIMLLKNPLLRYTDYSKKNRGMSVFYDWIDWLGGYPFEVATPDRVIDFCEKRGFRILSKTTTRSLGNNQFVFKKV